MPLSPLWEIELQVLLADQALESRDPGLVFLDRAGRLGVLVEGAGLIFVHPNPDQGAGEVVPTGQTVERLATALVPTVAAI